MNSLVATRLGPDEVVADLADVLQRLYRDLEAGATEAASWFEQKGRGEFDAHLACHITRFVAARRLGAEIEQYGGERDVLALSGLKFRVLRDGRAYVLRVRRSRDGELPPAKTRALADFYAQPLPFPDTDVTPSAPLNLVVLWTPIGLSVAARFVVVCPKSASPTETQEFWRRTIEVPEFTVPSVGLAAGVEAVADDVPLEEVVSVRRAGE